MILDPDHHYYVSITPAWCEGVNLWCVFRQCQVKSCDDAITKWLIHTLLRYSEYSIDQIRTFLKQSIQQSNISMSRNSIFVFLLNLWMTANFQDFLLYIIAKTFLLVCDFLVIIIDYTSQYSTSDISHGTQRQQSTPSESGKEGKKKWNSNSFKECSLHKLSWHNAVAA